MPTVPTLPFSRQVELAPLPGVRRQAAETPLSEGANVAEARGRLDQAAAGIASQGAQMAVGLAAKAQDDADATARVQWQNKLANWQLDKVYSPDHGALALQGEASFTTPETLDADYQKFAGDIAAGLNGRQRGVFEKDAQDVRQSTQLTVRRHVSEQIQQHSANEMQATVANSSALAAAEAHDPAGVQIQLNRGITAIQKVGPQLGFGPEEIAQRTMAFTTAAHSGVIDRLIEDGYADKARIWYDERQSEIGGTEQTVIENKLDVAGTAQAGLKASSTIWDAIGPKGDSDPIKIADMEAAARAQFPDDTKKYDATVRYLRERKASVDAQRQDVQDQTVGTLWKAVAAGGTLQAIQAMPEYLKAPGIVQNQIVDKVVELSEHYADRSYMLQERGKESAARAQADLERTTWAAYWDYSDPRRLGQMNENQILALTPTLGIAHVNRLMEQKRTALNSDEKVRSATMDDDAFKSIAAHAGFNPYGTQLTDDEKMALGQLRSTVETAIDAEQTRTGKLLGLPEKKDLMQSVIDRTVFLDQWGTDPEKAAAGVVNRSDQASAYVPLARIKPQNQAEWVKQFRVAVPEMKDATTETILKLYQRRIERAHAAVILGLGDDEAVRRLQGK